MAKILKSGEYLDRYLILDHFIGAWGIVYVVKDTQYPEEGMGRPQVTIAKTLRPELTSDPRWLKLFEEECYTWLSLKTYPHIVRLYTVNRFSDQVYAFGEYVPQTLLPNTLRGWIDYHLTELEIAFRFGIQIARALGYARQNGVQVHQDLKPENIMVTAEGLLKVTDWGASRMVRSQIEKLPSIGKIPYSVVTDTATEGTIYGTPGYAAPELYQPGTRPSPAADIYSLGVILVEMITGERPAVDALPDAFAARLEPVSAPIRKNVIEAVTACLAREPANRPSAVEAIEDTLCAAFEDLTSVPAQRRPYRSQDSGADIGQRAYALFMLGRIDEAMQLQAQLMERFGDRSKAASGMPPSPVVMMDYKEHGFRTIVPEEQVAHIQDRLASSPDSLESLELAISTYSLAGEHETVLQLIEDWLKHSAPTADLLASAAYSAKELGRRQTALDYLDRSLALDDSRTSSWKERAEIFGQLGNVPEAIGALKELLRRDPKDVNAHLTLGNYYAGQDNQPEAFEEFQAAADLDPKNAIAFYNLGTTYLRFENQLKAIEALEKCIELDKDLVEAYNTLAGIYFHFAQIFPYGSFGIVQAQSAVELLETARDLWDEAIRINPRYAKPWFNKGQMLEFTGDNSAALECFRQAVELNPNYGLAIDAIKRLSSLR